MKKKLKNKKKRKKKLFTLTAKSFFLKPIFWTFLYQTVMNFYFTFTLLSIEVWILLMKLMKRPGGETEAGIYFQQLRK